MSLKGYVEDSKEKNLRYGLNHALKKWLVSQSADPGEVKSFFSVEGFELNQQSILNEKLRIFPSVSWTDANTIEIKIQEFISRAGLVVPDDTVIVKYLFRALRIKCEGHASLMVYADAAIEIPYTQDTSSEQIITVNLPTKPADIVVVVLSLQYKRGSAWMENMKWRPGVILGFKRV